MKQIDINAIREKLISFQYTVSPENMNEACVRALDDAPPLPSVKPKRRGNVIWSCGSCGYPGMCIDYAYCPNCGREVKWDD